MEICAAVIGAGSWGTTVAHCRLAQPTPIRPWRGSPTSIPITTGTDSTGTARRSSANSATFSERFDVAVTRPAAATTSEYRTGSS